MLGEGLCSNEDRVELVEMGFRSGFLGLAERSGVCVAVWDPQMLSAAQGLAARRVIVQAFRR